MEGWNKKKKMRITTRNEQEGEESVGEDRISSLPDELIHHILSFSDAKLAVQTSVLSKRWKLIWTTLPFLRFFGNNEINLVDNFLSRRNHAYDLFKFYFRLFWGAPPCLFHKFINYAISHNVQHLDVDFVSDTAIKLSTFTPTWLKTLTLVLYFDDMFESDSWDLPALTTLRVVPSKRITLRISYLNCLSSLETLLLSNFNLPDSASLLSLKTLHLTRCNFPAKAWHVPALLTLTLINVEFPKKNASSFLRGLVNLQNLTLSFSTRKMDDWVIDCPQLVNLEIKDCFHSGNTHLGNILVTSQKISSFSSKGFFSITFEVPELENVNVKLWDCTGYKTNKLTMDMKKYSRQVTDMFRGLSNARILTLDSNTIKALSFTLDFLVRSPPPFYHLKYVKVPQGYKESSMSPYLKCYLLGNSPTATIVTTLPQDAMIPHTEAASVSAQHAGIEEPLAAPTEVLIDSVRSNEIVSVDTVDMGVQEGHAVQNSEVHDDRVIRYVGAPVEGTGNNRLSSSEATSDIGLWLGHVVKSEFVGLLDHIMNKYPETFEHFATKNKEFCTMKLNMLCTTVNNFTKIFMTEVNTEMISEYRDVFDGLQKFGFNISWLVNRLNYIEHLRFSQPLLPELHAIDRHIDDAKSTLQDLQFQIVDTETKLQNLQTLRMEKMQEIQKAFGAMGTNLAVGYIGDDLFLGANFLRI